MDRRISLHLPRITGVIVRLGPGDLTRSARRSPLRFLPEDRCLNRNRSRRLARGKRRVSSHTFRLGPYLYFVTVAPAADSSGYHGFLPLSAPESFAGRLVSWGRVSARISFIRCTVARAENRSPISLDRLRRSRTARVLLLGLRISMIDQVSFVLDSFDSGATS